MYLSNVARIVMLVTLAVLVCCPRQSAWALNTTGSADLRYSTLEQEQDGTTVSEGHSLSQNYYLNASGNVTPLVTYLLNLRANHNNTSTTQNGATTEVFRQGGEPQFELNLNNPMYRATLGYQRTETWDDASLSDEARRTDSYWYARYDMTPTDFPTLGLQWGHRENYDHLSPSHTDTTTDTYLFNTNYSYAPFSLFYNYYLTADSDRAPSNDIISQERLSHTHNGRVDFNRSLFGGKIPLTASYQGNYSRYISKISSTVAQVTVQRQAFRGLYVHDSTTPGDAQPLTVALQTEPALIDGDKTTPITAINLGYATGDTNLEQNIGLQLVSPRSVTTLRIYTNVATTVSFSQELTFDVYTGNTASEWPTLVRSAITVSPSASQIDQVYYYEISFSAATSEFLKVVNARAPGSWTYTDKIYVTEIEAWGPETAKKDVSDRFDQGVNFNTGLQVSPDFSVSFNFYLTRNDEQPSSLPDASAYMLSNIFSKNTKVSGDISTASATRSWGPSVNWRFDPKLLSSVRFQRQDSWDSQGNVDSTSDTYNLTLSSPLLSTLDATFSATRGEQYSFSEKQTVSNSYLFSTIAKFYEDLNVITDLTYSSSESYLTDTEADTLSLNGTVNATLTRSLSGTFIYGFTWPSPGVASNQQNFVLVYHPSSLLSLMGSFQTAYTGTEHIFTQSYSVDWLPFPVLNLNMSIQEARSGDTKTQSLSGQGRWQINRHMDFQLNYSLSNVSALSEAITQSISFYLSARF